MRRPGMRPILGGLVALGIMGAGAFAIADSDRPPQLEPRPAGQRPQLLLLTTLPLIFPDRFDLGAALEDRTPALDVLETRYRVVPVGVADATALGHGRMLLMAHALAQPAEALVDLDAWVRRGGRLLLLADPRLDWESERPLGDPLRPAPMFADTGLLAHWKLALEPPVQDGSVKRIVDGREVATSSVGILSSSGNACRVVGTGFVARCRIGKGKVTVIADADFLNPDEVNFIKTGQPDSGNFQFLLAELAQLER